MQTVFGYDQDLLSAIPFEYEEEDEFVLTDQESEVLALQTENQILRSQNIELVSRLQDLEKIIVHYAKDLAGDHLTKDSK